MSNKKGEERERENERSNVYKIVCSDRQKNVNEEKRWTYWTQRCIVRSCTSNNTIKMIEWLKWVPSERKAYAKLPWPLNVSFECVQLALSIYWSNSQTFTLAYAIPIEITSHKINEHVEEIQTQTILYRDMCCICCHNYRYECSMSRS